jgi:hypothetical protein
MCAGLWDFIQRYAPADNIRDFVADNSGKTWLESGPGWMNEVVGYAYDFGSDERLCFNGSGVNQAITDIAMSYGTFPMTPVSEVWGLDITRLKTPGGEIGLSSHPMFNLDADLRHTLVMFNPANVVWCPFADQDTHYRKGIPPDEKRTDAGFDGIEEEFYTQGTFEWGIPRECMILTNIGVDAV